MTSDDLYARDVDEYIEKKRVKDVHALLASALVAGVLASIEKTRTNPLAAILVRAHVENGARAFINEQGESLLDGLTMERLHWSTKSEDKSWRNTLNDMFDKKISNMIMSVDMTNRDPDTDFNETWCDVPYWGQRLGYPQPRSLVLDPVVFKVPVAMGLRCNVPARLDVHGNVWVPWRVGVESPQAAIEVWVGIDNDSMPTENLMRIERSMATWRP